MEHHKDIVLVVDYHGKKLEFRWFDHSSGEERRFNRPTESAAIMQVVAEARELALPRGGEVVWIMESTTGWARVKALLGDRVRFLLANVLQLPMPPKAYRRKTDKLDTARLLREYLYGALPQATQPDPWWRRVRRLVALREDLVRMRTALRNGISSYFAHESWESDPCAWSVRGMTRLKRLIAEQDESDVFVLTQKFAQLEQLQPRIKEVEQRLLKVYEGWPEAQRLGEIRGIGVVSAVSMLARIGPVQRFADAEQLIAYAGLAPGVRSSDESSRNLSIGGGGTDRQLRHYLIEASVWVREIPRYQAAYEKVRKRRGKKIGRIVVARMLLRSIHKMLCTGVSFQPAAA